MKQHKRRNPYGNHPLLRKGGAHERGRGAQRRTQRCATGAQGDEGWLEYLEERDEGGEKSPSDFFVPTLQIPISTRPSASPSSSSSG